MQLLILPLEHISSNVYSYSISLLESISECQPHLCHSLFQSYNHFHFIIMFIPEFVWYSDTCSYFHPTLGKKHNWWSKSCWNTGIWKKYMIIAIISDSFYYTCRDCEYHDPWTDHSIYHRHCSAQRSWLWQCRN